MDIKQINNNLKNIINEDENKMVAMADDLSEKIQSLKNQADKLLQRFKYRTQENVSYNEKQALDIYMKCTQVLKTAEDELYDISAKVIG